MEKNILIEGNLPEKENPKESNETPQENNNSNNKQETENKQIVEQKEIQTLDIKNPDTITETEQNIPLNNNTQNTQQNSNQDTKQETNEKDGTNNNINKNIVSEEIKNDKGEKMENFEKNEKKEVEPEAKKENNLVTNRIIQEEADEYSPIEEILKERQNRNNIMNNNQIYFTEANTLIHRDYTDLRDIHKSNSNKLYTLTSIPEYSNIKIKKSAETPMKTKLLINNQNTKTKNKNLNLMLNNLSPEIYMKKKFVVNKENDVNFLKIRIKKIEEDIQKRNEYDFKSAMKECKMQFMKDMKNKEKERQMMEENKKFEEKLKNMEEYRKNMINNRIKKILQRQNKNRNKKKVDANNNSMDNNMTEITIKERIEKINNEKIFKTLDSYDEKLPILPGMPKYEIIKMIKDKEEKNFCINTEQRLKDLEKNHRKNYLKHLRMINDKLVKQNELYNIRSEKCMLESKNPKESEEDYIAKEMLKRYNIKQNILREMSTKKEKAKENLLKNIENVKEKKELLIKQEQQKIKKIIKRLNRQKSIDVKKNEVNENINNHRIYFSNLQKENLNKASKEEKNYYNELILRQEDYFWMVNNVQKDENYSRTLIHKKVLQTQNKKENEMKNLNKFLDKMDRDNINNQKKGTKMKLFLEQRRIEIENKKKEEEEALLDKK